jgi:predicted RNase H-like HicB family nuclease
MDYAVVVMKLSDEDGGGYLARVPDLYGCMSDGSTPEEAVINVQDAISDWIEVAKSCGRVIPEPGSSARRAKEREAALIGTIKILSEQMDGIDGRLDELFSEIEHVRELMENQDAWSRLEGIFNFDRKALRAAPLVC